MTDWKLHEKIIVALVALLVLVAVDVTVFAAGRVHGWWPVLAVGGNTVLAVALLRSRIQLAQEREQHWWTGVHWEIALRQAGQWADKAGWVRRRLDRMIDRPEIAHRAHRLRLIRRTEETAT